jgi:ketosteroid isomerase-like protein
MSTATTPTTTTRTEETNRKTIERLAQSLKTNDTDAARGLFHADVIQEWPQSGERIRGIDNMEAINKNYPGFPEMNLRRMLTGGDLVVVETSLNYSGKPVHGVSIYELRDGKIAKETDYFADPFEAPDWRKQWVEKI